ncbi:MAG: hypothetical protein ACK4QW_16370 [Alphaproteobacteria bacterium]
MAPRVATTRTEPGGGRAGFRRVVAAGLIAAAGAALVGMAVPRLMAGAALVPGDPILRRILERKAVSDAELDRLAESRRAALAWHGHGRTGTDLGLALLEAAGRKRILHADRDVDPARRVLADALARAPANPHGWLRLAALEHLANGPGPMVARHLEISIVTGPAERELLFPRLHLALRLLAADGPEPASAALHDLVAGQLDWAWRADRRRTVLIALAAGAEDLLRRRLAATPDDAAAFERILAAARAAARQES